jgi:hypothetical protein
MCSSTSFQCFGNSRSSGAQHGIDEHRLAIEDVHRRIGHLAMHQQRHAELLHARQRRRAFLQVADAGIRIGRGAGRIELDRMDEAAGLGRIDFGRRHVVGQVQRHQRRELHPGRQRGENASR